MMNPYHTTYSRLLSLRFMLVSVGSICDDLACVTDVVIYWSNHHRHGRVAWTHGVFPERAHAWSIFSHSQPFNESSSHLYLPFYVITNDVSTTNHFAHTKESNNFNTLSDDSASLSNGNVSPIAILEGSYKVGITLLGLGKVEVGQLLMDGHLTDEL